MAHMPLACLGKQQGDHSAVYGDCKGLASHRDYPYEPFVRCLYQILNLRLLTCINLPFEDIESQRVLLSII